MDDGDPLSDGEGEDWEDESPENDLNLGAIPYTRTERDDERARVNALFDDSSGDDAALEEDDVPGDDAEEDDDVRILPDDRTLTTRSTRRPSRRRCPSSC